MDKKEVRDLSIINTHNAYIRGARAFSVWLINNDHLSYKSDEDKQLVELFIEEKITEADVVLAPVVEEWLRST